MLAYFVLVLRVKMLLWASPVHGDEAQYVKRGIDVVGVIMQADKKDGKDPWIEFYTQLRKKGPECRDGVLQDTRWDFFR